MVLRLDPDRPLIWRTPWSVQFGVEPPVAVLEGVDAARELLLGVLARGSSRGVLDALAVSAGAGEGAVDRLLADVAGVLAREPGGGGTGGESGGAAGTGTGGGGGAVGEAEGHHSPLTGAAIAVDGGGPAAVVMDDLLQRLGASVEPVPSRDTVAAVVIAHYAVAPRRAAEWLRADVPHLLVEFGDRSVRVGPVVRPGRGPCAQCIEMHRVDADPAWPVLASQVFQRRAPSADALGISTAAAVAARILGEYLGGGAGLRWAQEAVRIRRPEYGSGPPELPSVDPRPLDRVRFSVHPGCGCRSLPENARADARCSGVIRPPPTTVPGARGPG